MMMTPKPKFTFLTIRTTSILNISPSEVILINFRAHAQFHSDSSSSTRILEFFVRLDLFTRMLESFTRKTIFHSDDYIFTRKTMFHWDDYIFTRKAISYSIGKFSFRWQSFHSEYFHLEDNFTRMTIFPLGWLYFHSERQSLTRSASFNSDGNIFTQMIISSLGCQTFTRPVNFHLTGKLSLGW